MCSMRRNVYQTPESDLGATRKKTNVVVDLFRWLALVPAILLSWLILFFVGGTFAMDSGALDKNSGVILFWVLGSLSAITVMLVSFWVAPSRKHLVVNLSYIIGVIVSLLIIVSSIPTVGRSPFVHCSISAIISGGLTLLYLKRKSHIIRSNTNAHIVRSDAAQSRRPI